MRAAAILLLLAPTCALADASLPVEAKAPPAPGKNPDQLDCHDPEWPAIVRAARAFCEGDHGRACRAVRRAFRGCDGAQIMERHDDGTWSTRVDGSGISDGYDWIANFRRNRRGWKLILLARLDNSDCC